MIVRARVRACLRACVRACVRVVLTIAYITKSSNVYNMDLLRKMLSNLY